MTDAQCVSCKFFKPTNKCFYYDIVPAGVEPFFICNDCQHSAPIFSSVTCGFTFIIVIGSRKDRNNVCAAVYKKLVSEKVEKIILVNEYYLFDKALTLNDLTIVTTMVPLKESFPPPTWLVFTPLTHQAVIASYCQYYNIEELVSEDGSGDMCFCIDVKHQHAFYFNSR